MLLTLFRPPAVKVLPTHWEPVVLEPSGAQDREYSAGCMVHIDVFLTVSLFCNMQG